LVEHACNSAARSFSRSLSIPKPHAPFHHQALAFQLHFFRGVAQGSGRQNTSRPFPLSGCAFNPFFFFSAFVHHVAALFLMPIATSPSVLPRPATFAKMEDRKRPASGAVDDYAPPSKRQAVNGGGKSKDDSGDMKEEAWIEVSVSHDSPCVVILRPSRIPSPSEDRAYAAVALMPRPSCGDSWHQNAAVLLRFLALTVANARLAGNSTPGSSQASP
jgi:hypothetical protein